MPTPKWAVDLLEEIARHHGKYRKQPTLIFKKGYYWHGLWRYNGWTGKHTITIYAPYTLKKTDRFVFDVGKQLFLHEITHWLLHSGHHDKRFYRKLFRLCVKYDIGDKEMRSEFAYKPKASKKVYKQMFGTV